MNYSFNPSAKVRSAVYVITAVASPVIAYLLQYGTVTEFQAGLWLVLSSAVLGLARLNVTPTDNQGE